MVNIALRVLVRAFLQAGHKNVGAFAECPADSAVVKLIEINVLRERGWTSVDDEAGQKGKSLVGLDEFLVVVGVRDGTQNEGRVGLDDYDVGRMLISFGKYCKSRKIPFLHPKLPALSLVLLLHFSASRLHPIQTFVSPLFYSPP